MARECQGSVPGAAVLRPYDAYSAKTIGWLGLCGMRRLAAAVCRLDKSGRAAHRMFEAQPGHASGEIGRSAKHYSAAKRASRLKAAASRRTPHQHAMSVARSEWAAARQGLAAGAAVMRPDDCAAEVSDRKHALCIPIVQDEVRIP
jgi:hypothetical protein